MQYQQVTPPNESARDGLGWCMRHAQRVFNAPVAFSSARAAWNGQQGRHPGELPPPGVAVPIFFDHYGTYGNPARWGNWGHVCVMLADGRILTSPLTWQQIDGYGNGAGIYPNIASLQRDIGGNPNYLGWAEYLNGKQIVAPAPAPQPPPKPTPPPRRKVNKMLLAHFTHWAFFGPGFWLEMEDKAAVIQFKKQLDMKVDSVECGSVEEWNMYKAAAGGAAPPVERDA